MGKIRQHRAEELEAGMRRWLDAGHGAEFVTLTIRHGRLDPLASTLDAVMRGWSSGVIAGRAWVGCEEGCDVEHLGDCRGGTVRCVLPCGRRHRGLGSCERGDRDEFDVAGYVRVVEVTYGQENGWHPHVHALVLTKRPLTGRQRAKFGDRLYERWADAVVRQTCDEGSRPDRAHGLRIQPVTAANGGLGRYLCKIEGEDDRGRGIGYEMTRADLKHAAGRRYAPLEVLDAAVKEEWARARWREWVNATHGRRCMTYSVDARTQLGLGEEMTDEEIVDQDEGGNVVVAIEAGVWKQVARRRGADVAVLQVSERGAAADVRELIAHVLRRPPD